MHTTHPIGRGSRPVPPPVALKQEARNAVAESNNRFSTTAKPPVPPPLPASGVVPIHDRHSLRRRRRNRSWAEFNKLQRERWEALKVAPPWLVSLIAHLAFMLVLALITFKSEVGNNLLLTFTRGDQGSDTAIAEFEMQAVELDTASLELFSQLDLTLPPISLDVPIELSATGMGLSAATKMPGLEAISEVLQMSSSASDLSSMFSGRSGAMKQALLKSGGGTEETEDAVALGLAWLKRQQRRDGTWSMTGPYSGGGRSENQTAATSMAMLAFMGAGNTHKSGQYKQEVGKAVRWLVKQQDKQGFMAHGARDNERMYAQAQATIALCELYGMTGDYWLEPYAQKACDFACNAQSPEGGWRYVPRYDSDTSVTGWFVMGLKSGQAAGLKVSTGVFPKIGQYLDSVGSDYNAGYAYKVGHRATPSMTAEGILCRQYLGWHRNMPGMAQGLGSLVANYPLDSRRSDVYYWYYATQSIHHYGGPLWEEWNEKLRVDVPAIQVKQGAERGSWSPHQDAWGANAGRLYTTCLSLYCLEVYYRHLPLYKPEGEAIAAN